MIIKTASEIKADLIDFYSKIQNRVTDFRPLSVINGLFYSVSMMGEDLYSEIEEVRKQAFVATAEGEYLDRHIEGTFGIKRTQNTRSSGYVVIYSNSPIQNPSNLKLKCAYFDPEGNLVDADVAEKFVTSGNDSYAGKVFVLTAPANSAAVTNYIDPSTGRSIKIVDLQNTHPRFLILPVVSMLDGSSNNVPEGSINQYPTKPTGIDGVLNTYNPQSVFFATPDSYNVPFNVRFTEVNDIRITEEFGTILDVTLAYYFSPRGGMVGFEDKQGNKLRGRFYKKIPVSPFYELNASPIESDLNLDYKEAQQGTISLVNNLGLSAEVQGSIDELPAIKIKNDLGVVDTWVMLEVVYADSIYTLYDKFDSQSNLLPPGKALIEFLKARITDPSYKGLITRQVKAPLDVEFVYDPDGVMSSDGIIADSARIGGALEAEEDDSYRLRIGKYLSSLSKATDAAIETGALQVQNAGITYSRLVRSEYTPRGSTVLLINSSGGSVDKGSLFRVKKELERNWKASGINLIVKLPQQIDLTLLMTITLEKNFSNSKDRVKEQVRSAVVNYFNTKKPGQSVNYSDLLSLITEIDGVRNVWNMFFGKLLTSEFYTGNKAAITYIAGEEPRVVGNGYDYFLLKSALYNQELKNSPVTLDNNQVEDIYIHSDIFPPQSQIGIVYRNNGFSYTPTAADNYKRTVVTTLDNGVKYVDIYDDAVWSQTSEVLKRITNASDFIDFLISRRNDLLSQYSNDVYSMDYTIARLSSELTLIDYDYKIETPVPVVVSELPLKLLKEVNMRAFEVPRLATTEFNGEVIDFIGIDFVEGE